MVLCSLPYFSFQSKTNQVSITFFTWRYSVFSTKITRFHIPCTPLPIYLFPDNEQSNKPFFITATCRISKLFMFQNIRFIADLPQSFCGRRVALVFDVTTRTSPSKTVDEIRASVLADVIKRDFLEEILRAASIRASKDKRDQRNHKTPHKKRKWNARIGVWSFS